MNTDNTTYSPGTGWKILGELELQVCIAMENILYTWLTEVIHPLHLQADLLNQIIRSAQDSVARAIRSENTLKFDYIRLTVFVPSDRGAKKQTWGFFRLEKFERARENGKGGKQAVEFYLYWEGE